MTQQSGDRAASQAQGLVGAGALGGAPGDSSTGEGEALPRYFGKYMLMRKLASGGMAELFLALHRSVAGFEKLVVIKRILPQMNQDRQFIDMLLHEARIAATLSHPNIVQTFDVGQVDGTYFIAMEHIHGEDIRTIVRQMKKKSVLEFPLEHALAIIIGLASGLSYAHEKRDLDGKLLGIVHRDISPQNIVVTFSGDVKVVDFGVAKSLHATDESKGGHLKGKVPYMSPEQANGEDIDWRSDIFAVGVILFELTTGKRLFKGGSEYDTLKLICETEYPMPSDVAPNYPAPLERIVMKALAKTREARYQSAREMQADLESFVRQERLPVSAVHTSAWMQGLFVEKLREHKEDLQDIKQLADEISAKSPPPEYAPASTGSHPSARFDQSNTGAAAPGAAATIPPAPKRSTGLFVGLALAAAAAAGVGYFALRTEAPKAAETPSTTATVAPPAGGTAVVDAKGKLKIESDPPGAAVWINGDLRQEVTPTTIELPVGREIQIKLSKDGLESHRETVKFSEPGELKAINAKMDTGSVVVELDVLPEPLVWVDQKPWKGDVKKITGLSANEEHKIVVSASGYVAKTFTFTPKQGEKKSFKHVLVKMTPEQIAQQERDGKNPKGPPTSAPEPTAPAATGPGTIRVNAKGGYCTVTINGAGYGPTPVVAQVPAGTVKVSCKPESGAAQSQAVKLEPGGTQRVTFAVGP